MRSIFVSSCIHIKNEVQVPLVLKPLTRCPERNTKKHGTHKTENSKHSGNRIYDLILSRSGNYVSTTRCLHTARSKKKSFSSIAQLTPQSSWCIFLHWNKNKGNLTNESSIFPDSNHGRPDHWDSSPTVVPTVHKRDQNEGKSHKKQASSRTQTTRTTIFNGTAAQLFIYYCCHIKIIRVTSISTFE